MNREISIDRGPSVTPNERTATSEAESRGYRIIKRSIDVGLASVASVALLGPLVLIAIAIKAESRGSVLHWSRRVGKGNQLFWMPKFRSMRAGTPQLATHLLQYPEAYITAVGRFLRKTSLDELPQLYSILKGDLSFVGPRPALFNQDDLIALRTQYGIHTLTPGLTGWAQINGRDELTIARKVELEREYLTRRSILFDLRILFGTFRKTVFGTGVSH